MLVSTSITKTSWTAAGPSMSSSPLWLLNGIFQSLALHCVHPICSYLVLITAVICWLQVFVYNNVSINKYHENELDGGWSFHVEFSSLAPERYIPILGSPLRSPNL